MFGILMMDWDDRRQSWRAPAPEKKLLASQRYFRWALIALAIPAASTALAFVVLAITGL